MPPERTSKSRDLHGSGSGSGSYRRRRERISQAGPQANANAQDMGLAPGPGARAQPEDDAVCVAVASGVPSVDAMDPPPLGWSVPPVAPPEGVGGAPSVEATAVDPPEVGLPPVAIVLPEAVFPPAPVAPPETVLPPVAVVPPVAVLPPAAVVPPEAVLPPLATAPPLAVPPAPPLAPVSLLLTAPSLAPASGSTVPLADQVLGGCGRGNANQNPQRGYLGECDCNISTHGDSLLNRKGADRPRFGSRKEARPGFPPLCPHLRDLERVHAARSGGLHDGATDDSRRRVAQPNGVRAGCDRDCAHQEKAPRIRPRSHWSA
jgi:hypothetical protein